MAKAKSIPNLDCDSSADGEARKILRVRYQELIANRDRISTEDDAVAIHDLRISAKRLRYSLETFDFCFPDIDLDAMADKVREMQDILGRIHDLDVLVALLTDRVTQMETDFRARALAVARSHSDVNDRSNALLALIDDRENRQTQLGFYQVIGNKLSERADKYHQFESLWQQWVQDGVLRELEALLRAL